MITLNHPKPPKKKNKKSGVQQIKILITSVAFSATVGGWALMAAFARSDAPPPVVQQVQLGDDLDALKALPQIPQLNALPTRAVPRAVTRTRSSR